MKDVQIEQMIEKEAQRQLLNIELIASENYVSDDVLQAAGSILTNKYAEGYPSKRYYGGCFVVDEIEELARERAKKLFGAEHANVQPHSGAQANMAVYMSVLKPGDKVLGMNLTAGGHLTHGHPLNFSGLLYQFIDYGVDPQSERIDYEAVRQIALKERPKLIVAGASAYPRVIDFAKFREIADECGAMLMVDMAHIAGLVAAGVHPSPVQILSRRPRTRRCADRAEAWCCAARNMRPYWIRPCSRACRAVRSCTSSQPRLSACMRRCSRSSEIMPRQ